MRSCHGDWLGIIQQAGAKLCLAAASVSCCLRCDW